MAHRLVVAWAPVMVIVLSAGCARERERAAEKDGAVSRAASSGPVTVTLTARPGTIDLSQKMAVEVEVIANKDVTIGEPEYRQALSEGDHQFEYRVVEWQKRPAEATPDGNLRALHRYDVEFFLPGEYELPPAEVSFAEVRSAPVDASPSPQAEASPEPQSVKTETLKVMVRAPQAGPLSEEQLRDITVLDPVDLPRKWHGTWWFATVVLLGLITVLAVIARRRRRRRAALVVQVPAHEWARQQLAALRAEDLPVRGFVQQFYYRISAIVRGYIERRFAVSAPEMTTEEFLVAAAGDSRFGRTTTDELQHFLTACDLVKYALHKPQSQESDAVMQAAGDFVERTREGATERNAAA